MIIPFEFKSLGNLNTETQLINFTTKDGKKGLLKPNGDLLSETLYDDLGYVRFGLYQVGIGPKNGQKYGLMDKTGELILPIKFTYLYMQGGQIEATERKGQKSVRYNRTGKIIE